MASPALSLDQISLRCTSHGGERGLIIGGVGSGKSTLATFLAMDFVHRYAKGRLLIVDSKPRFRADKSLQGLSLDRHYRRWGHGQKIPGCVLVQPPDELALAWSLGYRIVIVQCESLSAELLRLLAVIEEFFKQASAKIPTLVLYDEALDFFSLNGMPKGHTDIVVRCARAGRERGLGVLFCSQRTKGYPASIIEELERLYLFRLDAADDIKRLTDFGCPVGVEDMPREQYKFRYWYKADYATVYGPYQLAL